MRLEDIEREVMNLGVAARAELAQKLLLSLEAPAEEEHLALWVAEAERRLAERRNGQVEPVPVDEVFRRAYAELRCVR